jgi:hypothetical protein
VSCTRRFKPDGSKPPTSLVPALQHAAQNAVGRVAFSWMMRLFVEGAFLVIDVRL